MASNKIKIEVDDFLKATRIFMCEQSLCRHNQYPKGELNCNLKEININCAGHCKNFEEIDFKKG